MKRCHLKQLIILFVIFGITLLSWIFFDLNTPTLLFGLFALLLFFEFLFKYLKLTYPKLFFRVLQVAYRILAIVLIGLSFILFFRIYFFQLDCSEVDPDRLSESDYLIVLGAGLKGDQISERLRSRLDKALKILNSRHDLFVIVSGGQGGDEWISEAEAMGNYLIENGVPETQIFYEDQSTSTRENFLYSSRLLDSINNQGQVIFVTSDYHLFRASMIARDFGLQIYGICAENAWYKKSYHIIREVPATVKDWVKTL